MTKNLVALILFFLFSLFFHKVAQLPFELFVEYFDHVLLRNILLVFGAISFLTILFLLFKKLQTSFDQELFTLWIIAGSITLFSYFFLMPYKAESMHLIQYAIMGGLALKVLKYPFTALNLSFLLGIIDELFQFIIGWSAYLDFNDMVFNFCGSFVGILILLTFSKESYKSINPPNFYKPFYVMNFLFGISLLIGIITNQICFFSDQNCWVHLCRWPSTQPDENFYKLWETLSWGDQWHRVRPIVGSIVIIVLPLTAINLRKI